MLSIIVQGPLHYHSLSMLKYYQQFGQVIISCYDTDDKSMIPHGFDGLVLSNKVHESNFKYIVETIKTGPLVRFKDNAKIFYQALSTFAGAMYAQTEFIIKVRSDEQWCNLQPFIDKMLEYPDRYTTCNIFFQGHDTPAHPSDHVIGGKRQYFVDGLGPFLKTSLATGAIDGASFGIDWFGIMAVAETPMFFAFLLGKNLAHTVTPENISQITFDNTMIVDIDDMQPYMWSCLSLEGREYHTDSKKLSSTTPPSLKTMDEFWIPNLTRNKI